MESREGEFVIVIFFGSLRRGEGRRDQDRGTNNHVTKDGQLVIKVWKDTEGAVRLHDDILRNHNRHVLVSAQAEQLIYSLAHMDFARFHKKTNNL